MNGPSRGRARLRRWGRLAWAALGILGVLVAVGYVASLLSLVVIPLVLALFPATLLAPVAGWLRKHGTHRTAAALATLVTALLLLVGVGGSTVALMVAGMPAVLESAEGGLSTVENIVQRVFPDFRLDGVDDLFDQARAQVAESEQTGSMMLGFTTSVLEILTGMLLMVVILFFYLRNGRELTESVVGLAPRERRGRVMEKLEEAWFTLGAYFRGQLLVALVDAVLIGLGLFLLGIPLALPLAILVFFGGLFPIVGALVTGAVAVLVALSDGGLTIGLIVAGIVLAVQQIEGNVLEPLILSRAIHLHPLVIILSIMAGSLLLGVLGAFLAVPVAAVAKAMLTPEKGAPA